MALDAIRSIFGETDYNIPRRCEECGGVMIFKGVGEYHCEDCKHVMYDDYGKVRLYIETHPGARSSDVSAMTGVSQHSIRQMLRENKLEIASNSASFLKCERCGINIRSGRFCKQCEIEYHRALEERERASQPGHDYMGTAKARMTEDGEKRFIRSK